MFPLEKVKRYESKKHLDWIRSKNCCSCGCDFGIDAHHIIGIGHGIMGSRESDALTIPLCRICHNACHKDPAGFDQLYYFTRLIKQAFQNNEIILITKK
jgi:hypothetical protein